MHEKAAFVFWITLVLYLVTLFTVSYVGVYLTYIAIPLIVLSGLVMKLTKPKENPISQNSNTANIFAEIEDVKNGLIREAKVLRNGLKNGLEDFNQYLDAVEVKREKTQHLRDEILRIRRLRINPEVSLPYAKSDEEVQKYKSLIAAYDAKISELNNQIIEIENQCDRDYAESKSSSFNPEISLKSLEERKAEFAKRLEALRLPDDDGARYYKNAAKINESHKWKKLLILGITLPLLYIFVVKFFFKASDQGTVNHPSGVESSEISGCDEPLWTTARSLVVRDSPNPQANKVGSLPYNSKICVQGSSNGWFKVPHGWVSSRYTQASPVANKPVVHAPETAKPITQDMLGPNPVWSYKKWELHYIGDAFLYFTHGRKVYGHQFGMIKRKGMCSYDHLWLTMSSFKSLPSEGYSESIRFDVDLDNSSFPINVSLIKTGKFDSLMTIAEFSNFLVGDEFLALMSRGRNIELRMISPADFVRLFDIQSDNFSLDGFVAANMKAQEYCERLQ